MRPCAHLAQLLRRVAVDLATRSLGTLRHQGQLRRVARKLRFDLLRRAAKPRGKRFDCHCAIHGRKKGYSARSVKTPWQPRFSSIEPSVRIDVAIRLIHVWRGRIILILAETNSPSVQRNCSPYLLVPTIRIRDADMFCTTVLESVFIAKSPVEPRTI